GLPHVTEAFLPMVEPVLPGGFERHPMAQHLSRRGAITTTAEVRQSIAPGGLRIPGEPGVHVHIDLMPVRDFRGDVRQAELLTVKPQVGAHRFEYRKLPPGAV